MWRLVVGVLSVQRSAVAAKGKLHTRRHAAPCLADEDLKTADFSDFQVTLADGDRSLECRMLESETIDGRLFASLVPIDTPAVLAAVDNVGELAEIDDEPLLARLLPNAREACADEGLSLIDSALTLTLGGDLSELLNDDDDAEQGGDEEYDADEADDEPAEVVAEFESEGVSYYVLALTTPLLLIGRRADGTDFVLPSEEEAMRAGPVLERLMEARVIAEAADEEAAAYL